MRGTFKIQVDKRKINNSPHYKDKWSKEDVVHFINVVSNGAKYFKVVSQKRGYKPVLISRDELAFIRIIFVWYGAGDYNIKTWAKGKTRKNAAAKFGYRVFWDGIITEDHKFLRRRNTFGESNFERTSLSMNDEQHISHYCKTKRAGQWWNL